MLAKKWGVVMESSMKWAKSFFDKFEDELIKNGYSKLIVAIAVLDDHDDHFEFDSFEIDQVVKAIRLLDVELQLAVVDRYLLNKNVAQICEERLYSRATYYRILRKATKQLKLRIDQIEHTGVDEFEKIATEVAV